jgi:hypothetical protein
VPARACRVKYRAAATAGGQENSCCLPVCAAASHQRRAACGAGAAGMRSGGELPYVLPTPAAKGGRRATNNAAVAPGVDYVYGAKHRK